MHWQRVHRQWSFIDHCPQNFLSEDSEQTMVEAEEENPIPTPTRAVLAIWMGKWGARHRPKTSLSVGFFEQDLAMDGDEDKGNNSDTPTDVEDDRHWLEGIQSWTVHICMPQTTKCC
jgi:hypothetical protein